MTIVDGIVGKIGGDFIHNGSRLVIGRIRSYMPQREMRTGGSNSRKIQTR
jgi:hypothetical protein